MPYEIDIPGGTAELWEVAELTPRKQMPLSIHMMKATGLVAKMQKATGLNDPAAAQAAAAEGKPLEIPDIDLTDSEAEQFLMMQYLTAFVHLKSWTLDLPLPASGDDLLDYPAPVVQALSIGAQKAQNRAREAAQGFEETDAAIEDPESPTTPSGPSGGQSSSETAQAGSTGGEPGGSPSTSSSKRSRATRTKRS